MLRSIKTDINVSLGTLKPNLLALLVKADMHPLSILLFSLDSCVFREVSTAHKLTFNDENKSKCP